MPISTTNLTPSATVMTAGVPPTGGTGEDWHFVVGGVWVPGDKITITLTDTLTGIATQIGAGYVTGVIPSYVITFNNKVYALSGSTYYFSALNAPTVWNSPTGVGNGFVTISNYYASAEQLQAAAPYQGRLAFINRRDVQIWAVDPIPANYALIQTLLNIGTYAPASVVAIGDMDVYMLYDSGVRSLRVRDASNNAIIADIGTPIDALIQAMPQQPTACGIADPSANRYWLFIPNADDPDNGVGKIYAFSYFPSSQIAAWSTYSPTWDSPSALALTATAASTSQINLVWGGAVSDLGALTYNLYRSTASGFFPSAATLIATGLTIQTYSDTGLTQNTTYYYYAIGIDPIGNQILSNEANATTQGTGSQPGPFVLTATDDVTNPETQIDLSWTTPSGSGITYDIYRDVNPAFTPGSLTKIVSAQSGTTFNDTGLTPGTQYWYYVYANNTNGTSISNESNATTRAMPTVSTPGGIGSAIILGFATDASMTVQIDTSKYSFALTAPGNIFDVFYSGTYSSARTVNIITPNIGGATIGVFSSINTFFAIQVVSGTIASGVYSIPITTS